MVIQLVTMTVKPEYEQEFLDFVTYFVEKVHANESDRGRDSQSASWGHLRD